MTAAVAVVTDSTACLAADLLTRYGIRVVPLRVVSGGAAVDEGPGALSGALGAELRAGAQLSTASPAPATFSAAYAAAQAAGARSVVSVHLSGSLSGTVNSAQLAAASAPVPVRVVDSRSLGMGLGIAALAAAEAAEAGGALDDVAAAASGRAARLGSFFVLDTLEQLTAGGRLAVRFARPRVRPDGPAAAAPRRRHDHTAREGPHDVGSDGAAGAACRRLRRWPAGRRGRTAPGPRRARRGAGDAARVDSSPVPGAGTWPRPGQSSWRTPGRACSAW